MSRNWVISGLAAAFLVIMSPITAPAQDTAAVPDAAAVVAEPIPEPVPAADAPLVVSGVHIDKTDKNSVLARDAAFSEARKQAFQILAERNMGEAAAKALTPPADSALMSVVKDLEITSEQLSATRYVADFTVRFNEGVYNYIKPKMGTAPVLAQPGGGRSILVLPYLELNPDKRLLWEDGNMWMDAWRSIAANAPPPGWSVTLPFGDIEDVSAGPSDSVWLGDYKMLDALRARYAVQEIILAVAAPTVGAGLSVDLYSYGDNGFADLFSITPVAPPGEDEAAAYRQAASEALASLQEPVPTVQEHLVPPGAFPPRAPQAHMQSQSQSQAQTQVLPLPAPSAQLAQGDGRLSLDAEMVFSNPARWLEMQKRLSTLTPPVRVDIRALSSKSASFTLRFDGTLDSLQTLLTAQGVGLAPAGVNIAEDGGGGPTRQTVYALSFLE